MTQSILLTLSSSDHPAERDSDEHGYLQVLLEDEVLGLAVRGGDHCHIGASRCAHPKPCWGQLGNGRHDNWYLVSGADSFMRTNDAVFCLQGEGARRRRNRCNIYELLGGE